MTGIPRSRSWLFLVLFLTQGCQSKETDATDPPVRVFVAASAKEAVADVADLFTKETGVEVKVVSESSSRLATQIVSGAPADIFLSANQEWVDFVNERGFGQETRPLLTNDLVLIVPKGNPSAIVTPEDLSGERVKHVALAGPVVPAGIYARQALSKLGLLEALTTAKKIVAGDDVRSTLAYVERREVEAGVVYSTDARITSQVEIVYRFDPSTHGPIRYPLVLLKAGRENEMACRFFEFLQSPRSIKEFQKHGFASISEK